MLNTWRTAFKLAYLGGEPISPGGVCTFVADYFLLLLIWRYYGGFLLQWDEVQMGASLVDV
ncbi:uncharacterized protein K444DRAFT_363245 [Hyaloscypha bicolor E]|uniref:Uncharacterized protein n=1 Tax=Hyaloscypha bicolor E TaxID=1095630 RepID=A0A2J6TGM2_9HELO|nr:uncharacterized protein K444DRAFT_363245 [Hyaloscypha bicolor E]PMD62169.1 hypothetical protein K444DRAFT_363245 [Hyaloscypha bicolor E]